MKRLTNEIETLTRNIDTMSAGPGFPAGLREQFELTCIARDAAALDRRLDASLTGFFAASHRARLTREELDRAARRACVFAAGRRHEVPHAERRALRFRRAVRGGHTGDFHGLSPELLEVVGEMEGGRAAAMTLKLARALRVHIDAGAAATAAREMYTSLLGNASSLAGTMKTLNRALAARLFQSGAGVVRAAA